MESNDNLLFSAQFDSGNLAQVQKISLKYNYDLLKELPSSYLNGPYSMIDYPGKVDYEYLVWTRPDSFGSAYENANRTWFYFGIKGYVPQKLIRITIMNMNKQARLYGQGYAPLYKTIHANLTMSKWLRVKERTCYDTRNGEFRLTFIHQFQEPIDGITLFAFCFPWSYTECQKSLEYLDQKFNFMANIFSIPNLFSNIQNKSNNDHEQDSIPKECIYYYRELLCYSLDKLRVDLITVTDFFGIQSEREPIIDDNLFPESEKNTRCHRFKHKRVVFVTSRVHPGETPASHVFNGFLEFITRENDPRARQLRRQYVFKLVPILNPDGVKRGHYRTDSLGVNLNRMYLDPKFSKHPSIYAVKSLLVYYHVNYRTKYKEITNRSGSKPLTNNSKKGKLRLDNIYTNNHSLHLSSRGMNSYAITEGMNQTGVHLSFFERVNSYDEINESFRQPMEIIVSPRIHHLQTNRHLSYENKNISRSSSRKLGLDDSHSNNLCEEPCRSDLYADDNLSNEDSFSECHNDSSNEGNNIQSPHLCDPKLLTIPWNESGVALYIDLHGHCSKRGCFIYGNHIDNEEAMIENMLYPRLIALNTPHFDFSACNFTIKNMYSKDKRDGLSKIGAGRVAIMKHLGLVHSYTLECNYNSGRTINQIAPISGGDGSISPPPSTSYPPRYTPFHYIDVGKAMAIAALDMTDTNPLSRIINSELKSLTRGRDILRRYLHSNQWNSKMSFCRQNISSRSSGLPSMAQVENSCKQTVNVAFGSTIPPQRTSFLSKPSPNQLKSGKVLYSNYKSPTCRIQRSQSVSSYERNQGTSGIRHLPSYMLGTKVRPGVNAKLLNHRSSDQLATSTDDYEHHQKSIVCQTDHLDLNASSNLTLCKTWNGSNPLQVITSNQSHGFKINDSVSTNSSVFCYDTSIGIGILNNSPPKSHTTLVPHAADFMSLRKANTNHLIQNCDVILVDPDHVFKS